MSIAWRDAEVEDATGALAGTPLTNRGGPIRNRNSSADVPINGFCCARKPQVKKGELGSKARRPTDVA